MVTTISCCFLPYWATVSCIKRLSSPQSEMRYGNWTETKNKDSESVKTLRSFKHSRWMKPALRERPFWRKWDVALRQKKKPLLSQAKEDQIYTLSKQLCQSLCSDRAGFFQICENHMPTDCYKTSILTYTIQQSLLQCF